MYIPSDVTLAAFPEMSQLSLNIWKAMETIREGTGSKKELAEIKKTTSSFEFTMRLPLSSSKDFQGAYDIKI